MRVLAMAVCAASPACSSLSSPGGPGGPRAVPDDPAGFGGGRPRIMSFDHVRYEVTCQHCRVAWAFPGDRGSEEVKGPWEKRASFRRPGHSSTVSLDIVALTEGAEVQAARIYIDGVVRAEHRGKPGEPTLRVHLEVPSENFGPVGPTGAPPAPSAQPPALSASISVVSLGTISNRSPTRP